MASPAAPRDVSLIWVGWKIPVLDAMEHTPQSVAGRVTAWGCRKIQFCPLTYHEAWLIRWFTAKYNVQLQLLEDQAHNCWLGHWLQETASPWLCYVGARVSHRQRLGGDNPWHQFPWHSGSEGKWDANFGLEAARSFWAIRQPAYDFGPSSR